MPFSAAGYHFIFAAMPLASEALIRRFSLLLIFSPSSLLIIFIRFSYFQPHFISFSLRFDFSIDFAIFTVAYARRWR